LEVLDEKGLPDPVAGQPEVREFKLEMYRSDASASLWRRDGAHCTHLRQRHPLHDEALLICAWPGCPEGTRNGVIQVPVADDFGGEPVLARFKRETLQQGPRFSFRWKNAA